MDLINAKTVSINFFLWVKRHGAMTYAAFYSKNTLGIAKIKLTAQLFLLILMKKHLHHNLSQKNLRFELLIV